MKQTKNARQTALGVGVSLLVYLALLALLSLLIVRGTVGETGIGVCVWAFACMAAFAGAKVAAWHASEPLAPTALCVAVFWAAVVLLGFLVNDTLDSARTAMLALPVLTGGAVSYLLRGGKKRGKRKRRSRK